jgi:shikimate kinase
MRIFLAGVGCVGKTTIGERLAELLDYPFFDLDEEIEAFFGTSVERLQDRFLTIQSFREEASKALKHLLSCEDSNNAVIALTPSGLMGGYWRIVKKEKGVTIVLKDDPRNILARITFYDKGSRLIEKDLTAKEKRLYLKEIKKDITYFGRSYKRANASVEITGLDVDQAAVKVKGTVMILLQQSSMADGSPNISVQAKARAVSLWKLGTILNSNHIL